MAKAAVVLGRFIKQSGKLTAFILFIILFAFFNKFQSIFTQISKTEVLIEVILIIMIC